MRASDAVQLSQQGSWNQLFGKIIRKGYYLMLVFVARAKFVAASHPCAEAAFISSTL